jgi:hypothetical protein
VHFISLQAGGIFNSNLNISLFTNGTKGNTTYTLPVLVNTSGGTNLQAMLATLSGITFDTNTQTLTATGAAATSTNQPTLIRTNFVLNQLYTNNSGTLQLLNASVFLSPAAVTGDATMDLYVDLAGGTTYALAARVGISTAIGGLAQPITNSMFCALSNGATYFFTNSSAGAGVSAGLVAGTGTITTMGQALSYTNVPGENIVYTTSTITGPTNSITMNNGHSFMVMTTNSAITNVLGSTAAQSRWQTCTFSNSTANTQTLYIQGNVRFYGSSSTNAVAIASGKQAIVSWMTDRVSSTNCVTSVQQ